MPNFYSPISYLNFWVEGAATAGQLGGIVLTVVDQNGEKRDVEVFDIREGRHRFRFAVPHDVYNATLRLTADISQAGASDLAILEATLWQSVPMPAPMGLAHLNPDRRFLLRSFEERQAFGNGTNVLSLTMLIDIA